MNIRTIKTVLFTIRFIMLLLHAPLAARELTFALWNVENLFDTTDTPGKSDTVVSKAEYTEKIKGLARIIKSFDADVLGLCEVENITVLADLAGKSGYPYYYLAEGNDPRGIDVCILSRYPLEYTSHKNRLTPYKGNSEYKFSRDCVEAALDIEGSRIYILLTHLKSMAYGAEKSEKKRVAQAKGMLDIILEIYRKSEYSPRVLVMGDLNSTRYSAPLNILQKAGLINLNYKMNQGSFYTTKYKGRKQDLDYMLLNNVLFEESVIQTYKTIHNEEIELYSDHYPIILKLTFKK